MFERAPNSTRETIPFERGVVEDRAVLVVHAPSELLWELEPGRWRVEARFGIVPPAEGAICTDGATFAVVLRNAKGEKPFWRQALDPRARPADRPMQTVAQEFELPPGTRCLLRTNMGPNGDGACDWCYWTDVRFTRLVPEETR
jgi:hypothetical protein